MSRYQEDRLELLFGRVDAPRLFGLPRQTPQPVLASLWDSQPNSLNSYSNSYSAEGTQSTVSSASRTPSESASTSSGSSRRDSVSSSWSTAPTDIPIPANLNHQLAVAHHNTGYDLPCEFSILNCNVRFTSELHQEWISHCLSHFFEHGPPPRLVCTFCETEFDVSRNNDDRETNYRKRMTHIKEHFKDNRTFDTDIEPTFHPRPDFHLLDYMQENKLMTDDDHRNLTQYTERPYCENLRPLGFVPPDVLARRARDQRMPHDLAREERLRKKERDGKGKSTRPHGKV